MDMLGHDHGSTDGNIEVALRSSGKKDEDGVDIIASQTLAAPVRTKGDEVERTNVKDPAEAERSSPKIIAHAKTSSDAALRRRAFPFSLAILSDRPQAGGYRRTRRNFAL